MRQAPAVLLALLGCARSSAPPSPAVAPRAPQAVCLDSGCAGDRCKPVVIASGEQGISAIFANERFVAWHLREKPSGRPLGFRARTWASAEIASTDSDLEGSYDFSVIPAGDYLYGCGDGLTRMSPFTGAKRVLADHVECRAIASEGERIAWATGAGDVHVLVGDKDVVVAKLDRAVDALSLSGDTILAQSYSTHATISIDSRTFAWREDLQGSATIAGTDVILVEGYVEPGPLNEKNGIMGTPMEAVVLTSLEPNAPRVRLATKQINVARPRKIGGRLYWEEGGIYDNPVILRRARLPSGPVEAVMTFPEASTLSPHCAVYASHGEIFALPL